VVREGVGAGGRNDPSVYAHMNNKTIKKNFKKLQKNPKNTTKNKKNKKQRAHWLSSTCFQSTESVFLPY
jgi:hypothetical protein